MWSEDEKKRLWDLAVDPSRHSREDLVALVEHLRAGGTLFSVTDRGQPVHASQEFARKVRDLTLQGSFDWLVTGTKESTPPDEAWSSAEDEAWSSADMRAHTNKLLATLDELHGIEPLSIHDPDLVTWWSKPEVPDWPVPKGRAWREAHGVVVEFGIETRAEWPYLQEHLANDPLLDATEKCREALAEGLPKRLQLLDAVAERIRLPPDEGGLGLPIGTDLGFVPVTRPEVTTYYVFTIYDQLLSRALDLRHRPKEDTEFRYRDPGYPDVLRLGGTPAIRSTNQVERERAVAYLLRAQTEGAPLAEMSAAASAYQAAQEATKALNGNIERLRLMPGFPLASICDLCRPRLQETAQP